MKIEISAEKFWKGIALFAWRRWMKTQPLGQKPAGVPGNRDPDHPCQNYEPRPRSLQDWAGCRSDGHYLCRECCHYEPEEEEAEAS